MNADEYVSTGQGSIGNNMFAYCGNNPIVRSDSLGQAWWFVLPIIIIPFLLSGCSSSRETVKYDVPVYEQKYSNLCWAYCQIMLESHKEKITLSQEDADSRVKELAISVHGEKNWNKPSTLQNTKKVVNGNKIDTISDLYDILEDNGPVYASYRAKNGSVGHAVVITGVDVPNNIVYSNDPWGGVSGTQSFEEFKNGYLSYSWDSSGNTIYLDFIKIMG